ncbi:MAG: hypothetical protein ACR2IE_18510 [Candidatus Sumerlaeaceae bacterium]
MAPVSPYDDSAFSANPPSVSVQERLDLLSGKRKPNPPSKRAIFLNDIGALAGSIFGPMTPLFAMALEHRETKIAVLIAAISTGAFAGAMALRNVIGRAWTYFAVCLLMGAFGGALLAMKADAWATSECMNVPQYLRYLPAAICLGMYWCIGFALLLILSGRRVPKSIAEL